MHDFLDTSDLLKMVLSLIAGIVLGLERELKDKAAGLKTISIICLGATLFTILSMRLGGKDHATQIAAYVVSGVGFLGAGAIFKDGFNIHGLTTAGIIWLTAAVGMSIGFGEYWLAGIFLAASFVAMQIIPRITDWVTPKRDMRQVIVVFSDPDPMHREVFTAALKSLCAEMEIIHLKAEEGKLSITYSVALRNITPEDLFSTLIRKAKVEGLQIQ